MIGAGERGPDDHPAQVAARVAVLSLFGQLFCKNAILVFDLFIAEIQIYRSTVESAN
jgi:hypothetical protein